MAEAVDPSPVSGGEGSPNSTQGQSSKIGVSDLSTWGSAEVIISLAQPGDLIEFSRFGYQHWAVYCGGGQVIHIFLESKGIGGSAEVKKEPLVKVCGGNRCRINNLAERAKKKGLKPLPAGVILANAQENVGLVTEYKLGSDNCEFFATSCRYGQAFCQQIDVKQDLLGNISLGFAVFAGLATAGKLLLQRTQRNGQRPYETGNMTRAGENQLDDAS